MGFEVATNVKRITRSSKCAVCGKITECYFVVALSADDRAYFRNHLSLKDYSAVCSDCIFKSEQERTDYGFNWSEIY